MTAKPITLILGPFDPGEFETLPAYLVGTDRAIFVFKGALWAQVVRQSESNTDCYERNNGDDFVMIVDDVTDAAADIVPALIERWASITALQFIVRDMVSAVCDEMGLAL